MFGNNDGGFIGRCWIYLKKKTIFFLKGISGDKQFVASDIWRHFVLVLITLALTHKKIINGGHELLPLWINNNGNLND
jgi:hypothetical protein